MRRGDVFWALLQPRSGSEQRGRRPVIIVSHEGFLQVASWRSIIVVPVSTSPSQARRGPTAVPLGGSLPGLAASSVALCHQVTTLDREKLEQQIGALPESAMQQVEAGLKAAMALP